eukprot:8428267-Ditylum_brightwellii.AAC.1
MTGSGATAIVLSHWSTMHNLAITGNMITKKETHCKLEPHQRQSFYGGAVKGLPRTFYLLSLTKVEKQLENVITLATNIKKV